MSKRAWEDDFFGGQPPSKRGSQYVLTLASDHDKRWSTVSLSANINKNWSDFIKREPETAFSWICACPKWLIGSKGSQDEDDEENGGQRVCKDGCPCRKPAADFPDHPWVITEAGFRKFASVTTQLDARDPSSFNLITFNDHEGYGTLEVVEGLLLDFSEEKRNWKAQWAICEALALFLISGKADIMCTVDDGQAIMELCSLICAMFGSMFARLERMDLVGPDSEVKNLEQIMALYFRIGADSGLRGMGFCPSKRNRQTAPVVLAYAMKHNLTLRCPISLEPQLSDYTPFAKKTRIPAQTAYKNNPWQWSKALAEYEEDFRRPIYAFCPGPVGADRLDITTWTSEKRKKYNMDGKDPISDEDIKKIRSGMVLGMVEA